MEYEEIRQKVINSYGVLYKDSLAFDINGVAKEVRLRLLDDPVYLQETRRIKAGLFAEQLGVLNDVLSGAYSPDPDKDTSATILKALEMKQKLLLEDLEVTKDESNALNVAFVGMDKESFESLPQVTVNAGSGDGTLGEDFGREDAGDSFELQVKAETERRMEGRKE